FSYRTIYFKCTFLALPCTLCKVCHDDAHCYLRPRQQCIFTPLNSNINRNISEVLLSEPRYTSTFVGSSTLTPCQFTGCSFGAAAILQYESVRFRVESVLEEVREEKLRRLGEGQSHDTAYWHNWWNQLSAIQKQMILLVSAVDDWWGRRSEGQKTAIGIIALNTAVLCCWRIPVMQRTMLKFFTSNPASKTRCLPMLLSSFSHYSILHLTANMFVLWSFSTSVVSLLGREQFLALYLSGGVFATFISYVCKTATGRLGPSLGASGAIMTILAAVCTKMPEVKLGIIFLPMISFTAGNALKAIMALDTAGLVLGWRMLDHAAHLGGALFGVVDYVKELVFSVVSG
uniref:rhomboid protease n=1 Tax=Astyanax mexicanus TaxID=7994 RepID=A0A8B9HIW0_ASTMX